MAISASSYGVGNRIYNGGSNAPTRGTVDPMGYIDRGLNAPSQSRSGLAAAALSRLTMSSGPRPSETVTGIPAQPAYNPAGTTSGHAVDRTGKIYRPVIPQGAGQTILGKPVRPEPLGGRPVGNEPYRLDDPTAPPIPIHNGGPINGTAWGDGPNPHPGAPAALPYDPIAAAAMQQLNAERDTYHNGINHQLQQLEEQYVNSRRQDELHHPDDLRNLLNSAAARGMIQSSGYGYQLGQENNAYANLLANLDRSHANGVAGVNDTLAQYDTSYANQLQQIQAAAAARLAQQAGNLGLGPNPVPVGTMNPRGPHNPNPAIPKTPAPTKTRHGHLPLPKGGTLVNGTTKARSGGLL